MACVPLAHFKSTMIFALRDSRGNEPLAIHLGPVRGSGARAFHARNRLAIDLCAFGTLKSTMIFALRDSRGNEPLAIDLGPVRGSGARAFHARDRLAIDLCAFGTLQINYDLRVARFQGQRAPGYWPVCLWHTSNQL